MYVILVYDVEQKRVNKALKMCRQYLNWIQNSVFEGNLSEAKLKELMLKLYGIIDEDKDSVILFSLKENSLIARRVLGIDKNPLDQFM